jgi:asparagine synthetase B (glutamine-hydrolysing)
MCGIAESLHNEDGGIQFVFDGEIYNFQDLHTKLVRRAADRPVILDAQAARA